MGEGSQEHDLTRMIEKRLHDAGYVVGSRLERDARVIEVENTRTRRVSLVRVEPKK